MKTVIKIMISVVLLWMLSACQDQKIEVNIYNELGEITHSFKLEEGELLELPELEKEGYIIDGWYTDQLYQNEFSLSEEITQSISLYPKWVKDSFEISFDMGSLNPISPVIVEYEGDIILPTPYQEGYQFIGWYLDVELLTLMEHDTMPSHDLTLYPKWQIRTFTISFETGIDLNIQSEDYVYQQILDLPDPNDEGLTFLGWYEDDHYEHPFESTLMPAKNITLYAKWSFSFDIALITDGGPIDDQSYNQIAFEGMLEYSLDDEKNSIFLVPESPSIDAYMDAIDLAASMDVEVIIMRGFLFEVAAYYAQFEYPNIKFILLDGSPHNIVDWGTMETYDGSQPDFSIQANLVSIFYKEEELGFLAGYSSVKEGFDQLGFIGGMPVPAVVRYGIGYIAGAYYAASHLGLENFMINPEDYQYANTFAPSYEIQSLASQMYSHGVDIILSVSGGANMSIITAAELNQCYVFGVDVDMGFIAPSVINSAIKSADVVIYQELYHIFNHTFYGGITRTLGAEQQAIRLATEPYHWRFNQFSALDYDFIYQVLEAGLISIPKTSQELESFITQLGLDIDPNLIEFINSPFF